MTIDEAVEVLTKERNDHHSFSTDIIGKAEQLGIEALKWRQLMQANYAPCFWPLLSGETQE